MKAKKRINYADQGIARLSEHIDSLLIIPNDKLQKSLPKGVSFLGALEAANGVLYDAVSGFSAIINNEDSQINIDFADVRTVMTEAGTTAVMGIGIATGEERAEEAVEQAIACPLLEDVDLSNARGVLVHIVAGMDFTWDEYETVGDALREFASDDSQIIIGVTVDPSIDNAELHVTVIVTGLGVRRSDVSPAKSAPIALPLETAAVDGKIISEDEKVKTVPKAEEKKVTEDVKKPEGSYLDIPAFLRKQAD